MEYITCDKQPFKTDTKNSEQRGGGKDAFVARSETRRPSHPGRMARIGALNIAGRYADGASFLFVDDQLSVLHVVAKRRQVAHPHALLLGSCDLVADALKTLAKMFRTEGRVAPDPGLSLKPGARLVREWHGRTIRRLLRIPAASSCACSPAMENAYLGKAICELK